MMMMMEKTISTFFSFWHSKLFYSSIHYLFYFSFSHYLYLNILLKHSDILNISTPLSVKFFFVLVIHRCHLYVVYSFPSPSLSHSITLLNFILLHSIQFITCLIIKTCNLPVCLHVYMSESVYLRCLSITLSRFFSYFSILLYTTLFINN